MIRNKTIFSRKKKEFVQVPKRPQILLYIMSIQTDKLIINQTSMAQDNKSEIILHPISQKTKNNVDILY